MSLPATKGRCTVKDIIACALSSHDMLSVGGGAYWIVGKHTVLTSSKIENWMQR